MVGLLLLMITTQPERLPPFILVVPFILLCTALAIIFVRIFRWQGMPPGKSLRLGLIATSLPMLVLVLQSLGQLTIRDLGTILALFAIAYFYLSRLSKPASD
ncbi:MAG TPA: hypothetical protein VLF62_05405 [Candidatus Saccharimonadales bacterium]|nr:hypothetical protein [Candidatus Saccharimonadales bacterium]